MYLNISNPMDYHVALYIRLSREDETEGPMADDWKGVCQTD